MLPARLRVGSALFLLRRLSALGQDPRIEGPGPVLSSGSPWRRAGNLPGRALPLQPEGQNAARLPGGKPGDDGYTHALGHHPLHRLGALHPGDDPDRLRRDPIIAQEVIHRQLRSGTTGPDDQWLPSSSLPLAPLF